VARRQLPLWDEYLEHVKATSPMSERRDGPGARNDRWRRVPGQVRRGYPVHLDIAGTAWADREQPYKPKAAPAWACVAPHKWFWTGMPTSDEESHAVHKDARYRQ
jgi:hypothetical protein